MSSDLYDNIKLLTKNIVQLEDQLKILNEKVQYHKKIKNSMQKKLIYNIKKANLSDKAISYQNKKIFITNDKSYDVLSFKFLDECFMKLYNNDSQKVKKIIEFIKNQRNQKINQVIKIK